MLKTLKRLFYLMLIFTGLYFFGDFTLNGVNVRDFLQKNVTTENFLIAKDKAISFYELLLKGKKILELENSSSEKEQPEGKKSSEEIRISEDDLKKIKQLNMDHIRPEDRKKLEELLKKQLQSTDEK